MDDRAESIETLFETDLGTPDVHHTHPECPRRKWIVDNSRHERREIPEPNGIVEARKGLRVGNGSPRFLAECVRCEGLREFEDFMDRP